jgi:uncharacterized protein (DUF1330 family)
MADTFGIIAACARARGARTEIREIDMAAYVIANLNIRDAKAYTTYREQIRKVIEKFGGRFLVRGNKHECLEGTWTPTRLVLLEFPDMASLKRWYASPDYAPLIELRQRTAYTDVVALEGVTAEDLIL